MNCVQTPSLIISVLLINTASLFRGFYSGSHLINNTHSPYILIASFKCSETLIAASLSWFCSTKLTVSHFLITVCFARKCVRHNQLLFQLTRETLIGTRNIQIRVVEHSSVDERREKRGMWRRTRSQWNVLAHERERRCFIWKRLWRGL